MGLFGFKSNAERYLEKAGREYQERNDKITEELKEFYDTNFNIKEKTISEKYFTKIKNILLSNDFKIFSKDEIKNILLKKREELKLENKKKIEEEIILLKKELKKHNKKQLKKINTISQQTI